MLRTPFSVLLPFLAVGVACSSPSDGPDVDSSALAPFAESPASVPSTSTAPNQGAAPEGNATPAPTGSNGMEGAPPIAGVTPPAAGGPSSDPAAPSPPPADMQAPTDMMPPSEMTPPGDPPTGTEQNNPTPITPSAGCAQPNPPTGQLSMTIRGNRADYLVTLPANYSPTAPSPMIFGFHGRNRTYLEFEQVDASQIRTQLENRAVMVFPQSQGGRGWNAAAEIPPSLEFFEALYTQMVSSYCIDTSRVFAIGHSSGGYFSHILACRYGDRLRGIGEVAGSIQDESRLNCTGSVAALLVHGETDTVVPFAGAVDMRNQYLSRNGCSQMTSPGPVAPCVTYQGCEAGLPVAWCQHTEPTYTDDMTGRTTNHGWSSFASQAIANFLFSLP